MWCLFTAIRMISEFHKTFSWMSLLYNHLLDHLLQIVNTGPQMCSMAWIFKQRRKINLQHILHLQLNLPIRSFCLVFLMQPLHSVWNIKYVVTLSCSLEESCVSFNIFTQNKICNSVTFSVHTRSLLSQPRFDFYSYL